MRFFLTLSLLLTVSISTAFSQESDLTIPNQKWNANFNKYLCDVTGPAVPAPTGFSHYNVKFEKVTTDATLDNGLLIATFEEEGVSCRYSAIIFADNTASTVRLVESKAFAPSQGSLCAGGKAVLDAALESNNYLYYGHPHNLAIMVPVQGAEAVCPGSTVMGVNFLVSGRIKP